MAIEDGHYVCCPICQGKGQMHRSDLIERLRDPGFAQTLHTYLERIIREQEELEKSTLQAVAKKGEPVADEFEREVHSWPPKRILWRRSPKE